MVIWEFLSEDSSTVLVSLDDDYWVLSGFPIPNRKFRKRVRQTALGFRTVPLGRDPSTLSVSGLYLPASRDPFTVRSAPQHWFRRLRPVRDLVGQIVTVSAVNMDFGQYFFESMDFGQEDNYLRLIERQTGGNGIAPVEVPFTMRLTEVEENLVLHQSAITGPTSTLDIPIGV